jgi:hypothetical protein
VNKEKPKKKFPSIVRMAEKAMKIAVSKVIEDHRKSGRPVAIWKNGKAAWISVDKA